MYGHMDGQGIHGNVFMPIEVGERWEDNIEKVTDFLQEHLSMESALVQDVLAEEVQSKSGNLSR